MFGFVLFISKGNKLPNSPTRPEAPLRYRFASVLNAKVPPRFAVLVRAAFAQMPLQLDLAP